MKRIVIDVNSFDGEKFAKRYGLKKEDFYARWEGNDLALYYPDHLPDQLVLEAADGDETEIGLKALKAKFEGGVATPMDYNEALKLIIKRLGI